MKRMLEREAQGANPHRGVLFQDPFYGALWGAYTACCPSFRGRTAPIGCPRHSGVRLGLWMTESMGWEQHRHRSLNICPPNFPRSYIMAAGLWGTSGGNSVFEDTRLPVGPPAEEWKPSGVQSAAGLRVDTRSSFIASAFTGQTKSNKHPPGRNHLQCVLKDTKETSLLGGGGKGGEG